jgi:CMP-N-acetylneuraminic acid synthetase
MKKSFLAVVPARAGSKGLPNKNILPLRGRPLISYSIEAGKRSKYIDEVVVSTDSAKIAFFAKKFGAKVPFMRPKELATDSAKSVDMLLHTVLFYKRVLKRKFDYLVLLQPTSPLRSFRDVDSAIELLLKKCANSVISVQEQKPLFSNYIDRTLSMNSFLDSSMQTKRRQELKSIYSLNGAIYIVNIEKFLKKRTLFCAKKSFAYVMSRRNSVDIDDIYDFKFASTILK